MQHHATVVRTTETEQYCQTIADTYVPFVYDKIGIGEARALAESAQLRPAEGKEQHFVLCTSFITHEAQNALLKLFEEPPVGAVFTLVIPPAFALLPTLRSRIGSELVWGSDDIDTAAWDAFVVASYVDRLALIDSWQKSKDKDPQWLQAMIAGVQTVNVSDLRAGDGTALMLVGSKLATRGASNKMLLEHLALILPLQK